MSKIMYICCRNTNCKYYFEELCIHSGEDVEYNPIRIDKNGNCEDFEEGECEEYLIKEEKS